ncbi:GumC family protein [Brassicibacter mesophilus]|uniref:GumC family protein n=1 Tax=Brassicibacter mesophilus TaxID=745119 RepID=UPI003D228FEA
MQQPVNQQYYDYDEISLRELIETLINGWKLIAVITAISLLVSGVFSFFIMDPTYEAKSILMASFATDKLTSMQQNGESIEGMLDSISAYPIMTIQTYKEQIKNPKILQQVIDELKLGEKGITRNGLRNIIQLETIKDTNLIEVKVTHSDPKLASDIANTVAKKFTAFITELSRQQASKSSQFLKGQLEVEKKKLDDASLELKKQLEQPRGANELREEFNSKLQLLTGYKTQLVEKEVELNKLKAGLEAAEAELKNTPQILVTYKSVAEDPLLGQIVSEKNDSSATETAKLTMKNEEVNETYLTLTSKVSEYKIGVSEASKELEMIRSKIDLTQKELETIQSDLVEKEHQLALVQRKVDLATETYNAFLNKYEETRIAESTEIGDSTINLVSQAPIPEVPVGPRKMLNLAIAGVLGAMVGVFIAFFRAYWQKSAIEAK